MSRLEAALRRAQSSLAQSPATPTGKARPWESDPDAAADAAPEQAAATRAFQRFEIANAGPAAEKLVVTGRAEQSTVEQYRKLAATMHHAQTDRELKVVMVSSAVSGDGKTLTATNLALTFSESYRRRVLLIDADLRRPSIHEVFQLPNLTGLTDSLRSDAEGRLPLVQASGRLSLLLAGRPDSDPMSALTSGRMRFLLGEAAAAFDWVIIDTPPLVLLPDANLLAAMVDAAILVIGAGKTPYGLITRAIEAVGRNRILGVVLNRADLAHVAGGYGYGYGYSHGPSSSRKEWR